MNPGTVAVAVINDTNMRVCEVYETAIAYAVFGDAQPDLAAPWYDLRLCSVASPPSEAATWGISVRTTYGVNDLVKADTVLVPSVPEAVVSGGEPVAAELVEALRDAAEAGARIVSLCTGAFALAEAGLLDGRRATTHWAHTADLAARYSKVKVDATALYVDEGKVLTSAGMTAGLDLCLHIIRQDLGASVANEVARRLVVSAHRPGFQAQFVDQSVPVTDDDSLGEVMDWALKHLDQPLTVQDMARRAGLSTRAFFRRFQAATGLTPLRWLLNQRVACAQALLETTKLPIERISEFSGFGTAANFRRHFTLRVGVTPTDYREGFRGGSGRR